MLLHCDRTPPKLTGYEVRTMPLGKSIPKSPSVFVGLIEISCKPLRLYGVTLRAFFVASEFLMV